jgi:hypothetical protein
MDVTNGTGTAYPSGTSKIHTVLLGFVLLDLWFSVKCFVDHCFSIESVYREEQTTQLQKEKGQKDKQRSTKHTCKTTDRVTRTPIKFGGEHNSALC